MILLNILRLGISLSSYNRFPPLLMPVIKISSSLNVVGLITTLAPFDRVHIVVPNFLSVVVFIMLPALGSWLINGSFETLSV